jgi:glycosyltransferase involved in cell wall biosynthesis
MKISIVTVCYNAEKTIGDTVRSVSEQSHAEVEHLVIDGESTDNTLSIVDTCGSKVGLRILSEPDGGIYDAMNKGIALATGEVVGFLNSDDFYASNDVLTTVARVMANPEVDACFGDLCYVRKADTRWVVRYWRSSPYCSGLFERGWCPPHPTFFVRREVYRRLGGFDLRYKLAADVELMMRFLEKHKVRTQYIQRTLVTMRLGGVGNRSMSNIRKQNREVLEALRKNGLRASPLLFYGHKLIARGKQFVMRVPT